MRWSRSWEGDPEGRRDRDPVRGSQRRPGDAGDAFPFGRADGRGAGKGRRPGHRWRFSGGTHGIMVGHVAPEAQAGGAIAIVREGDRITISPGEKSISLDVSEADIEGRLSEWNAPGAEIYSRGSWEIRQARRQRVEGRGHELRPLPARVTGGISPFPSGRETPDRRRGRRSQAPAPASSPLQGPVRPPFGPAPSPMERLSGAASIARRIL